MKRRLLLIASVLISAYSSQSQVTQINNNKSLQVVVPLTSTKAVVTSAIDSSIWTTDATLAGTVPVATAVKYEGFGSVLAGKFIFKGSTPATGSEIYVFDGTTVSLVSDINPGAPGSDPGPMALLNGFLYFAASRPAEGKELWRTNGTPAGTTLVKDIDAAATSSFATNDLGLDVIFSTGTYLLFAATTPGSGTELWTSDGTGAGTVLLKEINTGNANADSSNPREFYPINNRVLFAATDATHGEEIWTTDGTPGGTSILKDINTTGSSTSKVFLVIPGFPPFSFPVFFGFHTFNNNAYFQAYDGTSTGEVWSTDGSPGNATLVKDIIPGTDVAFAFVIDAVNLPNKFIFPVADTSSRSELWESDGSPGGTVLFKSFTPYVSGDIPVVYVPFNADFLTGTFTQPLFQGNKFFFAARGTAQGKELWISDGTAGGTGIVKDINTTGDGIDSSNTGSYLYTSSTFFFPATDGTHGNELWKTDGTSAGTSMVKDINISPTVGANSDPDLSLVFNNKVVFTATDGDDPDQRDLFVVDGSFTPLPVKLTDFTVTLKTSDALLAWSTAQELNTKNFTIQRSYDAQHFDNIGTVQASGNTSSRHAYSFIDAGIVNSGKSIVYYRLLATDKDGKSENSNIISLKLGGNSHWDVRLLTNPVRDNVNVILSGTDGKVLLAIQDMSGKTVYTRSLQNINGQVSLPVMLQKGVYILKAATNNEMKTIKFVR
jgi:ELWxxDGT repeat protein